MKRSSKLAAEFVGTFVLVFGGTGSAVLAAKALGPDGANTGLGIGFAGVALAFGLTVVTMAYAVGHISGGHFNPAITVGLATAKRFEWKEVLPYVVSQVVAALAASATLWVIAINQKGMTKDSLTGGGFAANGFGDHSPRDTTSSPVSSSRSSSPPCSWLSSWAAPTNGPRRVSPPWRSVSR